MSAPDGMTELERLVELQAIYHLKDRRDHAVDRKDRATYAELHTDDYVAMSLSSEPIAGGNAAAQALSVQLANVTTVHHCHTPVIYRETYVRGHDGRWRFSYRKLERTHAETSPGASIMAADFSGENLRVGVAN